MQSTMLFRMSYHTHKSHRQLIERERARSEDRAEKKQQQTIMHQLRWRRLPAATSCLGGHRAMREGERGPAGRPGEREMRENMTYWG